MPQSSDPFFMATKNRKAIQKAWARGKRTIVIDGRAFKLSKAKGTTTRAGSLDENGKKKPGKKEHYISVKPADGSLLPTGQIQLL